MATDKYIHGYTDIEQQRLIEQGKILSEFIFKSLDMSHVHQLLEVGMGVGAMTLEILQRYPQIAITGIEISEEQIQKAHQNLSQFIDNQQVTILHQDARATTFPPHTTFDGAFLCWILEHVPSPERVLLELHRILKPNSPVFITEVFHHSLHLYPFCPNAQAYWEATLAFQRSIGGDASIGHRLGAMLHDAGYHDIRVFPQPMFFDKRQPEYRQKLLLYWLDLMESALENTLRAGFCNLDLWQRARAEILQLMDNPEAIFYYSFMQAIAKT